MTSEKSLSGSLQLDEKVTSQEKKKDVRIQCKACGAKFKNIITHLTLIENCQRKYGKEYFDMKEKKAKERKDYKKKYKIDNAEKVQSQRAEYRKKNADKIKEYEEKNKQKAAERKRKHIQENKEDIIKERKRYRQENKEKLNKKDQEYYEKTRKQFGPSMKRKKPLPLKRNDLEISKEIQYTDQISYALVVIKHSL